MPTAIHRPPCDPSPTLRAREIDLDNAQVLLSDVIDVTPPTLEKIKRRATSVTRHRPSNHTPLHLANCHRSEGRTSKSPFRTQVQEPPSRCIRRVMEWAINLSGSWQLGHSNHVQYAIRVESSAPSDVRLGREEFKLCRTGLEGRMLAVTASRRRS